MSKKITVKHVDAQVDILNNLLGKERGDVESISFRFLGNGGNTYILSRVSNENGGISSFYNNTLTPLSRYLDGLIEGARLMKWSLED